MKRSVFGLFASAFVALWALANPVLAVLAWPRIRELDEEDQSDQIVTLNLRG